MKKFILLIAMLVAFVQVWAQERTVSGKVTSEEGESLPGVNVLLQGTSRGAVTDIDGNYTLAVPQDGGTLVFSFIGLESQEVPINNRSVIDVVMQNDVTQLSEVVVTGYGIERAPNEITYQTDKVDAETLLQGQQQVAAAGLTGKVAGLQINIQNNGVNPQTQILLRGLRSISSGNEAMIVIDGAIATAGAFNDLNPQDIQSIDILKGANAGALYGSRAANGAVIVTTKRGRKGQKFTLGVNSSLTLEEVSFLPDMQTRHGIGWAGAYDPIENTNWGPRFDGVPRRIGPDFPDDYPVEDQIVPYAPIQDNLLDFYKIGKTFQNTAYFTGGDETSTYYVSVGRTNTEGIVPDDEYERTTFRVNASKTLGKLTLSLNSSYFEDETHVVGNSIGDQDRTLYWFVLNTPANIPLKDYSDWDNPLSYGYADNYYNAYYQNPYWAVGTNRDNANSDRLVANINAAFEITEQIDLSGRIGVNRQGTQGKNWRDAQTYDPDLQPAHSAVSSFLVESAGTFSEVNGNLILSGDFNLSSDFTITPFVGAAFIDTYSRSMAIQANNLSIPGFYDISNRTGEPITSVNESQKRVFGVFGDVTFGFQEWAFLNLAGRQDYTSTLPADNNGYFYPAVSLSLILSEAFPSIVDNNILSFVKLTGSNATVYNDLGAYQINERYLQPAYFPLGSVNGFETATTTVSDDIRKEKLNTWEFGLNLGFLNDRFSLDAAYFSTITTDLITSTTPSTASGAHRYLTNIGQLTSNGYEFTLSGTVLELGDFVWYTNANYTSYETVVDEIAEGLTEIAIDNYGTYGTFAIVGQPYPQIKAQSYARDPQGRVVVDPVTGNPVIGDVIPMGKTTPDYIIGWTNRLSWKGLTASATLDYRTGHIYYSQGNDAMEFTGRSVESVAGNRQDFVWPNSVIQQGDGSYVVNENLTISDGIMGFWQNHYNEIKENYVKDATTLKIREVAVSYQLPESLLSRTGFVSKLSVGFVSRNLYTRLANQSNFSDPEFRNTRSTDSANGIGIGGYLQSPPTRSYGFTVNIEF